MKHTKYKYKNNKNRGHSFLVWAAAAIIIAVIIVSILGFTGVIHLHHHQAPTPTTADSSTKGEPSSTTPNSTPAVSSSKNGTPVDQKDTNSGNSAAYLLAPSGDFVSAHHVTLSSLLTSVCNTTTGATCVITFKNSDTGGTKSLPAEMTDSGGAAYWSQWTPQSIGLTTGSWTITATATLNGQSKSTSDALSLEISQ